MVDHVGILKALVVREKRWLGEESDEDIEANVTALEWAVALEARYRELEAKLESVGEILAWIYGMGTGTVEECKKGMRWPWAWEAEKALQIIGKMACDYRAPSDFDGSAYWKSDRKLAVTHRSYQAETEAEPVCTCIPHNWNGLHHNGCKVPNP